MLRDDEHTPLTDAAVPSSSSVPPSEHAADAVIAAPISPASTSSHLVLDSLRPAPSSTGVTTGGQNAGLWAVSADAAQVDLNAKVDVSPQISPSLSIFKQDIKTGGVTVEQNSKITGDVTNNSSVTTTCRIL